MLYIFNIISRYGDLDTSLIKEAVTKIEAFEMWKCRSMCRVSWIYKVSNKKVLEQMQKET